MQERVDRIRVDFSPRWLMWLSVHMGTLHYSETTWAVGIAQLTHHEVQGGAKIPTPEVEGFLPPPGNQVVS